MLLRSSLHRRYGYILAVAAVVVATALFFHGRTYFAKGQWALLYLLIVGSVAHVAGFRPALLAALLSFLAWNYFFLPPYGTFYIADPKDWLSLFVFLAVGVVVGLQTGKLRERESQALAREHETALLNRFSARLVSDIPVADMTSLLIDEVMQVTSAACVALFLRSESGELYEFMASPGATCQKEPEALRLAKWVCEQSKAVGLPVALSASQLGLESWPISVDHSEAGVSGPRTDLLLPLQSATWRAGVLYIAERRDGQAYSLQEARLLVGIANLASAFLERKHLQSAAVQADALREADRLKSTLISSVSHELKTPLASITATVTNMLEQDVAWEEASARPELQAVRDDLERLNSSIGALVDLSRLESAAWEPKRDWYELGEILGTAIAALRQAQRDRISVSLPDDLPMVHVDFHQWSRVFQNLLENALVYGGSGSPVRIGASSTSSEVRMWVEDEGPGIAPEERDRIFDKFFRGASSATAPSGTGLGLAITREIVRFHGGRIWVEDVIPHGARFAVSLPTEGEAGRERT